MMRMTMIMMMMMTMMMMIMIMMMMMTMLLLPLLLLMMIMTMITIVIIIIIIIIVSAFDITVIIFFLGIHALLSPSFVCLSIPIFNGMLHVTNEIQSYYTIYFNFHILCMVAVCVNWYIKYFYQWLFLRIQLVLTDITDRLSSEAFRWMTNQFWRPQSADPCQFRVAMPGVRIQCCGTVINPIITNRCKAVPTEDDRLQLSAILQMGYIQVIYDVVTGLNVQESSVKSMGQNYIQWLNLVVRYMDFLNWTF